MTRFTNSTNGSSIWQESSSDLCTREENGSAKALIEKCLGHRQHMHRRSDSEVCRLRLGEVFGYWIIDIKIARFVTT